MKHLCFSCFACIIHFSSGSSLVDVCHKNDFNCQNKNFENSGRLHFERCKLGNILRRLIQISMLNCVKECIMTSQCISFNYRYDWLMCELLGDTKHIISETGCIFSDIATWPKVMAGECRQHRCKNGERCIFNGQNQLCEKSYCIGVAVVKKSVSTERFGVHRNIGAGVKFKCEDGYKLEGWPYSVCLPSGEWENYFSCVDEAETGSCPEYWIFHNEHCYFFSWEELTWNQAKTQKSGLVQMTLRMKVGGYGHPITQPYSIFLGDPNSQTTITVKNIVHTFFSDKEGGWNDMHCSNKIFFTCEKNASYSLST